MTKRMHFGLGLVVFAVCLVSAPLAGAGEALLLEGYCDPLSVRAGEEVGFCVSTDAQQYDLEVARVGAEDEVVWTKTGIQGTEYPLDDVWPLGTGIAAPMGRLSRSVSALTTLPSIICSENIGRAAVSPSPAPLMAVSTVRLRLSLTEKLPFKMWVSLVEVES